MNKYDVFISYNWNDEKLVNFIISEFDKNDISYFLDKSNLKLYDKLNTTLKDNIKNSKYLVSVISQNYLESYWCLFEAIEAISSEDLEIKFLPIIVKYNDNDISFDENFILESIENLNSQIQIYENKIIRLKAFSLSTKLDKLEFIKSNLPKIYERMQERIYPIFELYNKERFQENLKHFILHINKKAKPNTKNINIDFSNEKETFTPPIINNLPTINWATYIGKQKWKNTPIILGDDIFVGSAGESWNIPDEKDGVYCLNINTGRIKWFYQTVSDVNKISFFDGVIIGGCDNGRFFCISSKTGKEKWNIELDSGIVTTTFKHTRFDTDELIVATYNGIIYTIDIKNGNINSSIQLNIHIMGDMTFIQNGYNNSIFIPTLEGTIYELKSKYGLEVINKFNINYPDEHSKEGYSVPELYSKPLIIENNIYQAFARQTYYDYPAIVCIDKISGNINWFANDSDSLSNDFGNIRTELLEFQNEIIFIHPYSNELIGISKENGKVIWITKLGREMFQQWSSPIIYNDDIYIARYDGYIYKIDGATKKREWSMYLGEYEDAGAVFNDEQSLNTENETTVWEVYKGYSLLSTPSISKNNLIIGSDEGYLYCISNINL